MVHVRSFTRLMNQKSPKTPMVRETRTMAFETMACKTMAKNHGMKSVSPEANS